MLLYLDGAAVGCFVLFILLLIIRAHRIRRTGNYGNAGKFTVFLSWLLIIGFFVSISGIAYGATDPAGFDHLQKVAINKVHSFRHHDDQKQPAAKSSQHDDEKDTANDEEVTWTPEHPELDGDSVNVKFTVPEDTKVVVQGHVHHQEYGRISADDETVTKTISFDYAAKYDVIITHDGEKTTKTLTIE